MNRRTFFGRTAGAVMAAAILPAPSRRESVEEWFDDVVLLTERDDDGYLLSVRYTSGEYLTPQEARDLGVPWRGPGRRDGLMPPPFPTLTRR